MACLSFGEAFLSGDRGECELLSVALMLIVVIDSLVGVICQPASPDVTFWYLILMLLKRGDKWVSIFAYCWMLFLAKRQFRN